MPDEETELKASGGREQEQTPTTNRSDGRTAGTSVAMLVDGRSESVNVRQHNACGAGSQTTQENSELNVHNTLITMAMCTKRVIKSLQIGFRATELPMQKINVNRNALLFPLCLRRGLRLGRFWLPGAGRKKVVKKWFYRFCH